MRLSKDQVKALHDVLEPMWNEIPYQLFLYGSRIHDHLKGGDIDLLILTNEEGVRLFKDQELNLLVQIKKEKSIGQRRLDLKAVTQKDIEEDTFLKVIATTMIQLV